MMTDDALLSKALSEERILFVDTASASLSEKIRGRDTKIISFVENTEPFCLGLGKHISWNAYHSYDEHFKIWEQAYRLANGFVESNPTGIRNILQAYLHDLANSYMLACFFLDILRKEPEATFILPPVFLPHVYKPSVLNMPKGHLPNFRSPADFLRKIKKVNRQSIKRFAFPLVTWLRKFRLQTLRGTQTVVVTVEDGSRTRINLDPALKICEAFKGSSLVPLILTSTPHVVTEMRAKGFKAMIVQPDVWARLPEDQLQFHSGLLAASQDSSQDLLTRIFATQLYDYFKNMCLLYKSAVETWRLVRGITSVKGLLSLNETLPVAVACGLDSKGVVPWFGFFPVLLGNRPDYEYYPADFHFAYGEQVKDLMVRHGLESEKIFLTGSPTFEGASTMTRARAKEILSAWTKKDPKKPVISIATEGYMDAEIELTPIFQTLNEMKDVTLVLKLHPSDNLQTYQTYLDKWPELKSRITVLTKCDLDAVLAGSDLLICTISNIIVRAAQFNTPDLSCDFSNKTRVLSFADEGLAFGCRNPGEIRENIDMILEMTRTQPELIEQKLKTGIRRFNSFNDGRSANRIAEITENMV